MDKTQTKEQARRPVRSSAVKRAKKAASAPGEPGHKQRFDQLLDDVVFGKPTKR